MIRWRSDHCLNNRLWLKNIKHEKTRQAKEIDYYINLNAKRNDSARDASIYRQKWCSKRIDKIILTLAKDNQTERLLNWTLPKSLLTLHVLSPLKAQLKYVTIGPCRTKIKKKKNDKIDNFENVE